MSALWPFSRAEAAPVSSDRAEMDKRARALAEEIERLDTTGIVESRRYHEPSGPVTTYEAILTVDRNMVQAWLTLTISDGSKKIHGEKGRFWTVSGTTHYSKVTQIRVYSGKTIDDLPNYTKLSMQLVPTGQSWSPHGLQIVLMDRVDPPLKIAESDVIDLGTFDFDGSQWIEVFEIPFKRV